MTTIRSISGTKAVNITYNEFNGFIASYVQIYNGEQDVIESKSFSTENRAKSWAKKILA